MPEGSEHSRLEENELLYDDYEPELPEVGYGDHLVRIIFKFGDISYTEIRSWQQGTGTPLTAWEFETIMSLRSSYEIMKDKAKKTDCPAPFTSEEIDEQRIADKVNAQFDALWSAAA